MRPTRATIHIAALRHNLAVTKRHASHSRIMAVIKANGYGHGLLRAARALAEADGFAVLSLDEAISLREAGFQQPILLLEGLFAADELPLAAQHRLAIVVHNEEQLRMLEAERGAHVIDVYLKVNSGMNRLGIPLGRFWGIYDRLRACKSLRLLTLMTHFATADDAVGVTEQFLLFDELTREIPLPRSLANSAAILRFPHTHADWVRPGIMLYGATPFADQSAAKLGLQAAMTLESAIIAVQEVAPGQGVGYGYRFVADKPTRIGVVACGYADGYPRHAPNGTPIAVAGKMTRTLGRVSMDMLCLDLTDIHDVGIGSRVELWGEQVAVDAVAKAAGTVGYELLCALAPRVPMREG
jgi:alanine racemase